MPVLSSTSTQSHDVTFNYFNFLQLFCSNLSQIIQGWLLCLPKFIYLDWCWKYVRVHALGWRLGSTKYKCKQHCKLNIISILCRNNVRMDIFTIPNDEFGWKKQQPSSRCKQIHQYILYVLFLFWQFCNAQRVHRLINI